MISLLGASQVLTSSGQPKLSLSFRRLGAFWVQELIGGEGGEGGGGGADPPSYSRILESLDVISSLVVSAGRNCMPVIFFPVFWPLLLFFTSAMSNQRS